jgi:dihydrofolate reductase
VIVSGIVAMAENGVIGRKNRLPWHLPDDLQNFKRLTMGHSLVMGRKTFESIGRALPGRRSIVVTRQAGYKVPVGVVVAGSVEEALELAEGSEVFVVGGSAIYREALPRITRLYVTLVETHVEGDAFFPELEPGEWRVVSEQAHPSDERHEFAFRFRVLERSGSSSRPSSGVRITARQEPPGRHPLSGRLDSDIMTRLTVREKRLEAA